MKKIEIEKLEGEYPEIILKKEEINLTIKYSGNLDLYFVLDGADKQEYFEIDKSDFILYDKFLKLYENILSARIYDGDDTKEEYLKEYEKSKITYDKFLERNKNNRNRLKSSGAYNSLVKDEIITWCSDDYPMDIAPSFQIIKAEEKFIIKFDRGNEEEQDLLPSKYWISVRIRTSGSHYYPFHINFMTLFKDLKEIDLEDEQIHIEEYQYVRKLSKN